jgi:GTP-binding protein
MARQKRRRTPRPVDFTLAIVGRPNVGKSTLFNRLVGRRIAIVDDSPGVTRDRRDGEAVLGDLAFRVFDTAGWEEAPRQSLASRMRRQTEIAVQGADATLFVVDARDGITPMDRTFARWLRQSGKPVIVAANKSEGKAGAGGAGEAYALGLGDPIALSAEHGEGMDALYDAVAALVAGRQGGVEEDDVDDERAPDDEAAALPEDDPARPIRLAIIGRPNVGKSSLLNRLLGEERMLTGPEAGITRDAIGIDWQWQGRALHLVDTAGLRRKANVEQRVEAVAALGTLETIRRCDVAVLILDATQMLEKQDLTIARAVIEEGRALVVVVNKMDLLSGDDARTQRQKLLDRIEASLAQVKGVAIVPVSARTGRGLEKLMPAVVRAAEVWNRRVPTATFNRWLGEILDRHPPPLSKGRRIRIRYGTQTNTRPPTFALFVSQAAELPESYSRYLVNRLRQDFDMPGTPIRVVLRQPKNPYKGRES